MIVIDAPNQAKAIQELNKKYPGALVDNIRSYDLGRNKKRHWIDCHFEGE